MLQRSTIQLLRFHFSFFLLPVYVFALSQVPVIHISNAILLFVVLHLLIYPASNGYNSYMDRDESPIGGLSNPLQPTKQLYHATIIMDVLGVLLALFIGPVTAMGIILFIAASKAYSYRGIRLKKYPLIGFLTVFIFQGAWIFRVVFLACNNSETTNVPFLPMLLSSLLIGALYPLTQIYQHEADKADGVITISYLLKKRGTFIFSMVLFILSTALFYILFSMQGIMESFYYYLLLLLPVVVFFLYWMKAVWTNEDAANFRNSLRMNVLATLFTTLYFIILFIRTH